MSLCTDPVIHALGNYRRYKDEGDGERSQRSGRGTPLRTLAEATTLQLFRNCFFGFQNNSDWYHLKWLMHTLVLHALSAHVINNRVKSDAVGSFE